MTISTEYPVGFKIPNYKYKVSSYNEKKSSAVATVVHLSFSSLIYEHICLDVTYWEKHLLNLTPTTRHQTPTTRHQTPTQHIRHIINAIYSTHYRHNISDISSTQYIIHILNITYQTHYQHIISDTLSTYHIRHIINTSYQTHYQHIISDTLSTQNISPTELE